MKKTNTLIPRTGTALAIAALLVGAVPRAEAGHGAGIVAGIIGLAAVATVASAAAQPWT